MLTHLLPAGRSRVGSRHGGRAGGRIAWAAAKRARAGWLQIVAALLSDPEVAALLLGGDGRGVSARDARAAVEDALGGKSSISKRDLAEAMAQRAREEASPGFEVSRVLSPLLDASDLSELLQRCAVGNAVGNASSFIVACLGNQEDLLKSPVKSIAGSPLKSIAGSPSWFERERSGNLSTIVNFSQIHPDPLFVYLTPPDIAHAVT